MTKNKNNDRKNVTHMRTSSMAWTLALSHLFGLYLRGHVIVINTFKYHVFAPMGRFQLELFTFIFHRRSI